MSSKFRVRGDRSPWTRPTAMDSLASLKPWSESRMAPSLTLRPATPADAGAIAALHVASWRETYAGLLPADLLAGLSVDSRTALWLRVLAPESVAVGAAVWLAEADGTLAGFGACGAQRDAELREAGFAGEIGALYVLRRFQGRGLGRAILRELAGHLVANGGASAALWVLRENGQARRFYEVLGGEVAGERREALPESEITEIAYGWRDLRILAGGASG